MIPWRRAWRPTPVCMPGKSHRQRNLRATVHGVAKSGTQLKPLSTHTLNSGIQSCNYIFTFLTWPYKHSRWHWMGRWIMPQVICKSLKVLVHCKDVTGFICMDRNKALTEWMSSRPALFPLFRSLPGTEGVLRGISIRKLTYQKASCWSKAGP